MQSTVLLSPLKESTLDHRGKLAKQLLWFVPKKVLSCSLLLEVIVKLKLCLMYKLNFIM